MSEDQVLVPESNVNKVSKSKVKNISYNLDFKQKVVQRALELNNISAASREFKVTTSVVHRWVQLHIKGGSEALVKKSKRPHHQPKKTSNWIIDKIKLFKKDKPEVGAAQLSDHLKRNESIDLSASTIRKIMKKHNLPDGDSGYAESSFYVKGDKNKQLEQAVEKEINEWERFCRPNPNDLWQMDIMSFYIRDAHKVYLISALDDCSRMIVSWGLFREQTADNVLEVLKSGLIRHGAPKEVLTDQGAQFKHWGGVTQFEKLLKKLNVVHITARSHHPQTCGKIEAYHKTIHRELIDKEFFISQEQACEKINRYVEHYNYGRTHSSLNGFTPSDRYFNIVDAVKKYIDDFKVTTTDIPTETVSVGRGSKIYLIGKVLGADLRVQELGGQISIYINNNLFKEINLLQTNL